ncbi:MAG: hypothetical protein ISR82_07050 [Candidatus Marinimicrobia bacterium]|nr:hypothetical protein [Candidatus Neomarinimicrobiota bacterium]MBL7031394.1 hypothetical protein [Candidatus Neomarinimicrobiota bacterium]
MQQLRFLIWVAFSIIPLTTCSDPENIPENDNHTETINGSEIPKFVSTNYIEIDKISQISKFRSGIGHDYSDDFESCRSMKHYFQPNGDWSSVKIYSPVVGTVSRIFEEWAGTQVQIQSSEYADIYFIIFHVKLSNTLSIGDSVTAGQQLGSHIGSQTMSDIAVGIQTTDEWKLISYFDVLNQSLFENYQARGINSRDELIISKKDRDENPLSCNEDNQFANSGVIENWIILK